jgi:Gas vesicle protein G
MGLFTGLITLPLAPVRGVVWIAERVAEEVDRELYDEGNIRRQLLQLELDHEDGKLSDEERSAQEEVLLQRLAVSQIHDELAEEELADG